MRRNIYQRIYCDLLVKFKSGSIKSGDNLPATRELAKLYRCHRFTVMRVCQDLAAEGWIDSQPRSKYVASKKIPVTDSLRSKSVPNRRDLVKIVNPIPEFDLERTRYHLEFWGGQPDLRLFPKDQFRRSLSFGLKILRTDQLNYGLTNGIELCRKEVSEYLRRSRNLLNKEYLITNGSQEALYIICQAFLKPGDKIAIERKGYPPAWKLFENLGAELIPIDVDSEGFDTGDFLTKLKKHAIKMIYLTPLHQYPTTVTLSPRRRRNLIEIAEQNLIPILEDDYDHEFHYIGPPPAPISAETNMGIYICSFSKVLFPGARLGAIACDPKILKNMSYQKFLISRQSDSLAQVGLAAWIREGGFERHLRKMRRVYEGRYFALQDELNKLKKVANIDWHSPNGGMSIWVNLFKDSKKIADAARIKGAFFQYESSMDFSKAPGTHLRIGFAGVNEREIKAGCDLLKAILLA